MAQRDRAAVRVDFGQVELEPACHGDGLRREGLVALDHVHLVEREPALLERQLGGGDRAFAHDFVGHAGYGVGHQPRHRLVAGGGRHSRIGEHEEGRAVVDARRIAGRDRAAFLLESRLHLGQRFQRGVGLDMLVCVEGHFALFRLLDDRDDLRLEAPFGDRRGRLAVRIDRQLILLLARDAPLRRQVLCRDAHVTDAEWVRQRGDHHVDQLGVAHARAGAHCRRQVAAAAHHFHSAADTIVAIAQQDVLRRGHDALQPGRAQAVDRHRHRIHRQSGLNGGDARHIGETAFGGDRVAHGHVVDRLWVDPGAPHGLLHHSAGQLGRLHVGKRAAECSDRRAGCAQNHHITLDHVMHSLGKTHIIAPRRAKRVPMPLISSRGSATS